VGTEVRAMADGIIVQCYEFYWGTDAIEILHGGIIVRYGEVERRSDTERGLLKKKYVRRGDVIGRVGQLINPNGSKHKDTMLHLEMYGTNVLPITPGNKLSQKQLRPFERRLDLVDPSDTLDKCTLD
jgi:murein DD-endopeptidase MepM/ murein hydrolase activator NlpD